jgi:hypothetical protein
MSRLDDHNYYNAAMGQRFQLYVGIGNEVKFISDTAMRTPPPTIWLADSGLVPFRPTALLGPHRIGFVGEGVPFYGGYSHTRWRRSAINHSWSGTGTPVINVAADPEPQYPTNPQPAYALFTWSVPGIYEVSLKIYDENGRSHTGTRQVIVFASREEAYDGVTQVTGLSGSNSSGWSCSLVAKGDLSFLLNARGLDGYIPVVVYADFFYETSYGVWERKELGPNWRAGDYRDDPRIIFSGYLQKESIRVGYDNSTVTFTARTADMILEQLQSGTYGFWDYVMDGSGLLCHDLQTHDVIRHMLQEHSNFADWHDLRCAQDATDHGFYPSLEYKDWTWNQGVFWSNVTDIAANQFEHAYVSNHGELFVTYDRNMWNANMYERTYPMGSIDARQVRMGPENDPISIVSASPISDLPYIVPLDISVEGRLSQGVSYYKVIGSLSFHNEEWGADYPRGAPRAASGRWVLDSGRYLSDDFREQFWNQIFWHWACRGYAAANARYDITITLGMHTYWRIQDIVELRYADPQGRVVFAASSPHTNYFEVTSISYDINTEGGQWRTTYTLRELTIYTAPVPDIPTMPAIGKGTS